MSKNEDIELMCIVGTGIPQPIALIVLSEKGKSKSKEELTDSLTTSINNVNPGLQTYEKIEKAVIMEEEWSIDNGLLTPTLKTKRSQIEKIHMQMYPVWFEMEGMVIWE
jgi:long-chain acyl-CoA synthetase